MNCHRSVGSLATEATCAWRGIVRLTEEDVGSAGHAAYFGNDHLRISLPSSSLSGRNHQSLRLVIFPIFLELSRC